MRICYGATDIFIPGTTGGTTHTFELARALTEFGHEVHVVCRKRLGQTPEENWGGVVLHRIPRNISSSSDSRLGDQPGRSLRRSTYHIYLHTVFTSFAALYMAHLAKRLSIQVFIERGTSFGEATFASIITARPLILEVIGQHLPPLAARRSKWVLAFTKDHLKGIEPSKIRIVHNAVNMKVFSSAVDGREVRQRLGVQDSIVVGYAGGFVYWHDIKTLVDAAKNLIAEGMDLRLLLVGPCPEALKQYIADSGIRPYTILTGVVPYQSVPTYLAACNILAAPYLVSLGASAYSYMKLYEYGAMGKPIITTRGIPDQRSFEPTGAAVFVDERDPLQMARAIRGVVSDSPRASMLGERARQVAEGSSWRKYAEQVNTLLKNCF